MLSKCYSKRLFSMMSMTPFKQSCLSAQRLLSYQQKYMLTSSKLNQLTNPSIFSASGTQKLTYFDAIRCFKTHNRTRRHNSRESRINMNDLLDDVNMIISNYSENIDKTLPKIKSICNKLTSNLKQNRVDNVTKDIHYLIVQFITSKDVVEDMFMAISDSQNEIDLAAQNEEGSLEKPSDRVLNSVVDVIGSIMINETYLFKRRQSYIKEEQLNVMDGILLKIFRDFKHVDIKSSINKVVKIMQLRLRKFKSRPRTRGIIEWYFEHVFGAKLTNEEVRGLNNYELSQLLLNISFLDYDLTHIESNLQGLKSASLERIENSQDTMSTKELCQIISTIYRMNLVFLKHKDDNKILKDAIDSNLSKMNLLDIQSILSGLTYVYSNYYYDNKVVIPLIERATELLDRMNSLTLTNLMKSCFILRIHSPEFYDNVVEVIKDKYKQFDNIALAYTVARMVRLKQFKQAAELFDFYEFEIGLFDSINNPHNVCQMLLALATMEDYQIPRWQKLMKRLSKVDFQNDRSCTNQYFVGSAWLFFALAKKEAPALYSKVLQNSPLEKFIENSLHLTILEAQTSESQMVVSNTLKNLGYDVVNEYKIDHKTYDMYIPEKNLLIEFNGPTHYLNGTDIEIGSDIYNLRLMPSDKDLMYIPFYDIIGYPELEKFIFYKHDEFGSSQDIDSKYETLTDYLKDRLDNIDDYKV
uniref:Putative RNA-binding protein n=1 Tax=Euplotes raikovi TaxID=5938 RepID=A0A7M3UIA5_EUPRA|nr:putative RNA-binding protein [Euplotes raikovi]